MSVLERLARRGHRAAAAVLDAFNPDQPRDERGRWGEGASTAGQHEEAAAMHRNAASSAQIKSSGKAQYEAHMAAAEAHSFASREHVRISSEERKYGTNENRAQRREAASKVAREASTKAHETSENPATEGNQTPYDRLKASGQLKPYHGNPAAEGSLAVKEDDRARSLSPTEHRIAQAMSSNRSDTKALQAAGMSREEGIKAAASAREKLGVPPGGSLKEAYKKLSPANQRAVERLNAATKASSKRDQPLKNPLKRGAYPGDPGSRKRSRGYPGD